MVFLKTEREVFTPTSSFATRIRSNESKNFAGRSAELPAFLAGVKGDNVKGLYLTPKTPTLGRSFTMQYD
jgi:hypothetical protein